MNESNITPERRHGVSVMNVVLGFHKQYDLLG
jgi:hypothetical protein